MEQDDQMDISVDMEPERIDVERLIVLELRNGPRKPKELTKIYKNNPEISKSKYYRALNRLVRTLKIDEMNLKGKRPEEYIIASQVFTDSDKLDLLFQEMIDSENEILRIALDKIESISKFERIAWYFFQDTRTRNKYSFNPFYELLNNSSPDIREQMIDILKNILRKEPSETRWKRDFKDEIYEKVLRISRIDKNKVREKALNLVGMINPNKGFEVALEIISDESLTEEEFKKMKRQIMVEIFESTWARNNQAENIRKLMKLLKNLPKTDKKEEIKARILEILNEGQII